MLKEKIVAKSKDLGFDIIGFSPFSILDDETGNLKIWLARSFHAGMKYMERNIEKRKNVKEILEDCESVISLGINYKQKEEFKPAINKGKVSRYAWGRDYHFVIWEKLEELIKFIKTIDPNFKAKSYVDTGPVMDKAWAVKSGLGWLGKHSNVINRSVGSWFFIANIFTNYKFDVYNSQVPDFCGTCRACIDACPTKAIVSDYVVDSNKCISYLTIENKDKIPEEFLNKFQNWIFGCDICQDVCPWNIKFSEETNVVEFRSAENQLLDFNDIERMTNKAFKEKFHESPILRTKIKGLKRNANFLKRSVNLSSEK